VWSLEHLSPSTLPTTFWGFLWLVFLCRSIVRGREERDGREKREAKGERGVT